MTALKGTLLFKILCLALIINRVIVVCETPSQEANKYLLRGDVWDFEVDDINSLRGDNESFRGEVYVLDLAQKVGHKEKHIYLFLEIWLQDFRFGK